MPLSPSMVAVLARNTTMPPGIPSDLIDALLADYKKPEDLIGQNGLLKQLTKALVERAT